MSQPKAFSPTVHIIPTLSLSDSVGEAHITCDRGNPQHIEFRGQELIGGRNGQDPNNYSPH